MKRRYAAYLASCLVLGSAAVAWGEDDPIEVTVKVPPVSTTQPPVQPPVDQGNKVVNAELTWGINLETRGRTYFGACNFAMAGWPGTNGNAKDATPWSEGGGELYHASSGNVSVVNSKGQPVNFAARCLAPDGTALQAEPSATFTDHHVKITKGSGVANPTTG
ncbi:MAG: hypothetical protein FWG16_04060, partial [Micrococcales bacterium]|nr:hypothetical protein [Micrococcales bacterium]